MSATQPFLPQRALISVSDKKGIIKVARVLADYGVELLATGNTAATLRGQGLIVTDVSECTGFPELMEGRVKTLHPAIHGALLARDKLDAAALSSLGIKPIDLLIVNLYPFERVISHPDCDFDQAIANIDIGGPAMIRAAAKNHTQVTVVVTPEDYDTLIQQLHQKAQPLQWRYELAKKAFALTAAYDAAISNYLSTLDEEKNPSAFPETFTSQFDTIQTLRYGENPHQQAIFYANKTPAADSLAKARLIQGKQLSYNNLLDADAALDCVKSFSFATPACVIVKHGNPCGIAVSHNQTTAYMRAYQTDPSSSFGGIIAFNQPLDEHTAQKILETQFAEVIIAPEISPAARTLLTSKSNLRVLETGPLSQEPSVDLDLRRVSGGLLVQEQDHIVVDTNGFKPVTERGITEDTRQDLLFAWSAVKYVKSNAIVFAKNQATLGIGAGQSSRVMSTRIAQWQAEQAGFSLKDAVMASDAFFPFADSIEIAAEAGITAIIQPGGSKRDQEVIDAANTAGISMIFTGYRHFRH